MTKKVSDHRKKAKKKIRKAIYSKLSIALSDYSTMIGAKRFDKSIRQMAKSFTADLLKGLPKKTKKAAEA